MIRAAVLFGIALCVFASTLSHPFVHDDIVFIVQNPHIRQWTDLGTIFLGKPHLEPAVGVNTYYRPLLEVIYRLEYSLFGLNTAGWHLFNVMLHGINGILVYRLLMLLGFSGLIPWGAAILFVVHPIQTEAVACVAGISNLVMAFFVFSALILYLKGRWFLFMGAFLAGLLAKEQALMVLPLIVLVDWYRGQRRLGLWFAVTGLAVGFLVFRQMVTGAHLLADILASPGELKLRVAAIAQVLVTYVQTVFLPIDLHYYRSTDILTANTGYWLVVVAAGIFLVQAPKTIRFSVFWFVLALLPVLNIVPLINEYSLILTAEHFLYVPVVGMGILIVVLIEKYLPRFQRWGLGAVVIISVVMSLYLNSFWKSEVSLFERTVAFEPNFGRGRLLLARAYYFNKQYMLANEHFMKAFEIMEGYATKATTEQSRSFYRGFMKGILFDWAHSLEEGGDLPGAKDKYEQAIRIAPTDPALWNNLGIVYLKLGDRAKADECLQKAQMFKSTL